MLATSATSHLILGTDSVLAAAPATPVQLAHACLRAGFRVVVPPSWGDELVAARALERAAQAGTPVVQVSCPHVSTRLGAHADAIQPMLLCLVPPPVAAAQYLRALHAPERIHITFAGQCPSGSDASIDTWLTPEELLAMLVERGVPPLQQPTEFDSVLPPDPRRHYSAAGGIPSDAAISSLSVPLQVVATESDDVVVEIAQYLLGDRRVLVSPSAALGCACVGSRAQEPAEPPRAPTPVVDHTLPIALDTRMPTPAVVAAAPSAAAPDPAPRRRTPASTAPVAESVAVAVDVIPRRRSPTSVVRPVLGGIPLARKEAGRHLPRAYIARRRSSPRGVRKLSGAAGDVSSARARAAWPWIALAGVGAGLGLAWLLGLAG